MDSPRTVYFLCVYLYRTWVLGAVWGALPHTSVLAPPVSVHPCSSGRAQALRPPRGYLVLEGHRSSRVGRPCPFPGSTQSFPLRPPRRSCCPLSGWSLGLGVRHFFSLVGKVEQLHASGVFSKNSNQEISQIVKVLKDNTFIYLTLGARCLGGKGNRLTQTEYIIPEP